MNTRERAELQGYFDRIDSKFSDFKREMATSNDNFLHAFESRAIELEKKHTRLETLEETHAKTIEKIETKNDERDARIGAIEINVGQIPNLKTLTRWTLGLIGGIFIAVVVGILTGKIH